MPSYKNRVGERINGLLIVSQYFDTNKRKTFCLYACVCNNIKRCSLADLVCGKIISCGCLKSARLITHGKTGTREFSSWCSMRDRCLSRTNKSYKHYGGRGIGIDPRWDDFKNFFADMGCRPAGTTLERKNNDKGYGPDNCVWATVVEQQRNTRRTPKNKKITVAGTTRSLSEWLILSGISYSAYTTRKWRGWDDNDLFQPITRKKSRK